jgi:drug/metabolite transporter (DMT)-like permease
VQQLEIAAIVVMVIAAVVFIASRRMGRRGGENTPATRLVIGSVLGLLGAVVILAPQFDVVPDGWQGPIEPILIGGVTLLLLLGSVYRMVR